MRNTMRDGAASVFTVSLMGHASRPRPTVKHFQHFWRGHLLSGALVGGLIVDAEHMARDNRRLTRERSSPGKVVAYRASTSETASKSS